MVIRALESQEWEMYRDLRLEALRLEPDAFGSRYEDFVDRPGEYWIGRLEEAESHPERALLFALDAHQAVGMVAAFTEPDDSKTFNLISMYVAASHRRRGIGRQLVDGLFRYLRGTGAKGAVQLFVNDSQAPAVRLYESCGFILVNQKVMTRPNGTAYVEFQMQRPLEGQET